MIGDQVDLQGVGKSPFPGVIPDSIDRPPF
jgi:hypothetical protein